MMHFMELMVVALSMQSIPLDPLDEVLFNEDADRVSSIARARCS